MEKDGKHIPHCCYGLVKLALGAKNSEGDDERSGLAEVYGEWRMGEARVRALLLERFTVLTRSVDTNGADFLVELRGGGRFSDELAPRLGINQAKFAQAHDQPELVHIAESTQRLSDKHALTSVTLDPVTRLPTGVTTRLVPADTAIVASLHTLERSRELWGFGFEGGARLGGNSTGCCTS